MINHVWSVLCTEAIFDSESNNVSIINVIEQINLKKKKEVTLPALIPIEMTLVSLWIREPRDQPAQGQARVILKTPSNKKASPIAYDIDLSKAERSRTRLVIHNLPIHSTGYHYFLVQFRGKGDSKWRNAAQIPLKIDYET